MNEDQLKQSIQRRMESSFSSLIPRGIIPEGSGFNFQQIVQKEPLNWKCLPDLESPACTIYTYSAVQKAVVLGDLAEAPKLIEKLLKEKDLEEYRKLCTTVECAGNLGDQMDECMDRIIRDGGGEEQFFWIPTDDGSMMLFHPMVMKRLHLKEEDWFGRLIFWEDSWRVQFTYAYQPYQPRYGIIIQPSVN